MSISTFKWCSMSCLIMLSLLPIHAIAGKISVAIEYDSKLSGNLGCALFSQSDGFPMNFAQATLQWKESSTTDYTCTFDDVATGSYAIAVMLDMNDNQKLDTSLVGIPTEAWGVSNNVKHRFRAPTFSEASFDVVNNQEQFITIRMSK